VGGARKVEALALISALLGCTSQEVFLPLSKIGPSGIVLLSIPSSNSTPTLVALSLTGTGSWSLSVPRNQTVEVHALVYTATSGSHGLTLGVQPAPVPGRLSRGVPAGGTPIACRIQHGSADGCWSPSTDLDLDGAQLGCGTLDAPCNPASCGAMEHDDGTGACAPLSTCAAGFLLVLSDHSCARSCPTDTESDPKGVCVPCAPTNGPNQLCFIACSDPSLHDGGDTICVPTSTCSPGFMLDTVGRCSNCPSGTHDGGDGRCVAIGQCAPMFGLIAGLCYSCTDGLRDDGSGRCVATIECANGYHDDGQDKCVATGCASCGVPDGMGGCTLGLDCPTGLHNDGFGTCVPIGSCTAPQHDGGGGQCVWPGSCSDGYALTSGSTCARAMSAQGHLPTPRSAHAMTMLSDGRVLIAGGNWGVQLSLASVLIYDPATGVSTESGSLYIARAQPVLARMAEDRILVASGYSLYGNCESDPPLDLYDAIAGRSSSLPSAPLAVNVLASLDDGRVFLGAAPVPWLLDPTSLTFAPLTERVVAVYRPSFAATLSDGRVLFGNDIDGFELYEPIAGSLAMVGPLGLQCGTAKLVPLGGGRALLVGCSMAFLFSQNDFAAVPTPASDVIDLLSLADGRALAFLQGCSSAVFDPDRAAWTPFQSTVSCSDAAHLQLPDGQILITGGRDRSGVEIDTIETLPKP
jgi:hypothetical protein